MQSMTTPFQDAIRKLNLLQGSYEEFSKGKKILYEMVVPFQGIDEEMRCVNLSKMENYLLRTGITLPNLDDLYLIHIGGTKGKGSTSAMCESILRQHGLRTGFYSSPHLVTVRERIRLDGRIISEDKFLKYFNQVYNMLDSTKADEDDMPKYNKFLTAMAFHVFVKEKVDVAIVEVSTGGTFDYTNVVRKVPVVGIVSLALDHTDILGNTLPRIAMAKAGIMKPGCVAYTVKQAPEALEVLQDVANKMKCPLTVVPDFKSYTLPNAGMLNLPNINIGVFQSNASLAIQLTHAWMRIVKPHIKHSLTTQNSLAVKDNLVQCLNKETVEGLRSYKWPGRCHFINTEYAKFYLDGAHTKESIAVCSQWFKNNTGPEEKILFFTTRSKRNCEDFLDILKDIDFKTVYFVVFHPYKNMSLTHETYRSETHNDLIAECEKEATTWKKLKKGHPNNIVICHCVSDALESVKKSGLNMPSVLITGSMYIVGAALSVLDPNFVKKLETGA